MKKINKKNSIMLLIATIAFLVYGVLVWISDSDAVLHTYDNPVLTDNPIYEEMAAGDTLSTNLLSDSTKVVNGLTILVVNTNPTGTGSVNVRIDSADGNVFFTKIDEKDIRVGQWNKIPVELTLSPEHVTKVTFTAVNCAPYFMYAPLKEVNDGNIALGTYTNEVNPIQMMAVIVKFAVLLIAFSILIVMLLGNTTKAVDVVGNDVFLALVYIFVLIGIYSSSYKNGIFITADSAGYLREAVNLKAGNGFGYDALAGYTSWFANWPILYPLMIFVVMFVSGLDAYLSSKIVTALLVLTILIILRVRFKKDAWLYSIALLNLGFVKLTYYTWSEIPFILFLLLFALKLGDIVSVEKENKKSDYVCLGIYGVLSFLTRYFGIFLWVVVGGYILLYLIKRIRTKEKAYFWQALRLAITALVSGVVSLGYMFLNKIMNGMPSGVSRSTWWDDYRTLTVDLFNSLIAEVFNVLHIDTTGTVNSLGFAVKVVFVAVIVVLVAFVSYKGLKNRGGIYSESGAFLVVGVGYYMIFTVIRYFSSMDTFYFRFFEPASFILTIGLVMLLINCRNMNCMIIKVSGVIVSVLVIMGVINYATDGLTMTSRNYYDVAKYEWDNAYKEIPARSVVIFSDLDYRSEYYRPDVVNGEITTADTWDTIKARYYGSRNLIIRREYAESMVECGEYESSVAGALSEGLSSEDSGKYIRIAIN